MARVRFPLIVRKTLNADGKTEYSKEGQDGDFDWVGDQLEATVYSSSKEFIKYWDQSATKHINLVMKHYDIWRKDHWLWELVYVGE